ncbi:MAG: serine/threonine-protein kinase [Rhodothermia bacterium]|nr:MAG: serine/threonine-protein kinase [Rhodothermia bacterium]
MAADLFRYAAGNLVSRNYCEKDETFYETIMIGKSISHYNILEKLGEGGMGVVYRAEDTKLKRIVAIKFLTHQALGNQEEKARFVREAQAAASLEHPNISTVFEIDESEGQTFIVMAYVEGQNLKEKIESGPHKIVEAIEIATQIAQGLQEAHEKGIVHRDIKSANIMVGEKGQAKIMDFGLAKLAGRTKLTKRGMTVGTTAYMSPEQARGDDVDHLTDIWSFGIVLYEMITGQLPFKGDYEQAVVYSVMNEDPEPVTGLRTGVPMDLERVVNKALAKNPDERYQSVSEILVDLKRLTKVLESKKLETVSAGTSLEVGDRLYKYGAASLIVIILLVAGVFLISGRLFNGSEKAIDSIAVLPLDNISGDPEQEYFVEGMHEALITDLSKISALKVISRTSTLRYKETVKSIPEIARELDVDVLVEGSVLRIEDQVRITVQLIRGATDEHLWANEYDRDLRNVLALLSGVAQAVADEIEVVLTPQEEERLLDARPVNPQAHEVYLKGRYFFNQFTLQDLQKSLRYFQEAIDIDSSFALAWAGLAGAHVMIAYFGNVPPQEPVSRSWAAALKAIELDDRLASAHTSLGWIKLFEWDWEGAKEAFQKALELNPNDIDALHGYGDYLSITGRLEEGLALVKRGWQRDPYSPIYSIPVAAHLYMMRRYDEAIAEAKGQLELDPDRRMGLILARSYWQKGMFEEALAEYRKAWRRDPERLEVMQRGYADSGPKGTMLAVAELLVARSEVVYVNPFSIAVIYARAEKIERAFWWLEKAYEQRSPELIYVGLRPAFDPIQSDQRFQDLLRRMGLLDYNTPSNDK